MKKTLSGQPVLHAGQLDERIQFQEQVDSGEGGSADDYGQPEFDWQPLEDDPIDWAMVQERDGREAFEADRLTARATTLFTIRYRDDIRETMRIRYPVTNQGEYYYIKSIAQIGRRVGLRIVAIRNDGDSNQAVGT